MSENDEAAVLDRLYDSLARGDLESALGCLTANAQVWHCFHGVTEGREEIRSGWAQLIGNLVERGNADIQREPIAGGFLQRHLFVGRAAGGLRKLWPVCLIVRIEDGLIARIDEYIDRAGIFELPDDAPVTTPGR